jgi:hypothetical protein
MIHTTRSTQIIMFNQLTIMTINQGQTLIKYFQNKNYELTNNNVI